MNLLKATNRKAPLRLGAILSLAFVGFNACLVSAEEPRPKIGMLIPLSGSYAVIGADNRNGAEASLKAGKSKVDLVYADSKADPTTSVSEFRKLVDSNHVVGVFAMRGPVGMALKPIAKSMHIPLMGGVGNREFAEGCPECFQLWSKSDTEGAFLASKVAARKFQKVALVTAEDDWLVSVSSGFREALKKSGVSLEYDQNFNPAETDFRAVVVQLKLKKPDVLFVNLALQQLGVFLKQAKEAGLQTAIYSNMWSPKKEVLEAAGLDAVQGVRFVEMNTNLPSLKKETDAAGTVPSGATLSSYAATLLFQQAVDSNPAMKTPAELLAALQKQTELKTPDGNFPIQDRVVVFPLIEKQINRGKVEVVENGK